MPKGQPTKQRRRIDDTELDGTVKRLLVTMQTATPQKLVDRMRDDGVAVDLKRMGACLARLGHSSSMNGAAENSASKPAKVKGVAKKTPGQKRREASKPAPKASTAKASRQVQPIPKAKDAKVAAKAS